MGSDRRGAGRGVWGHSRDSGMDGHRLRSSSYCSILSPWSLIIASCLSITFPPAPAPASSPAPPSLRSTIFSATRCASPRGPGEAALQGVVRVARIASSVRSKGQLHAWGCAVRVDRTQETVDGHRAAWDGVGGSGQRGGGAGGHIATAGTGWVCTGCLATLWVGVEARR